MYDEDDEEAWEDGPELGEDEESPKAPDPSPSSRPTAQSRRITSGAMPVAFLRRWPKLQQVILRFEDGSVHVLEKKG